MIDLGVGESAIDTADVIGRRTFPRRSRCWPVTELLAFHLPISAEARVNRLQSWARSQGITLPAAAVRFLSRCDSASEVQFALAFADTVGWKVERGDAIVTNGRMTLEAQVPIGPYRADFVLRQFASMPRVIEIDGPIHDTEAGRRNDAERTAHLELQGYKVLRLRANDVTEVARALRALLVTDALHS
jgi:very-short-patch-repair endonuclease